MTQSPGNENQSGLRRSACINKGQYSSTCYINEAFLSAVTELQDLSKYSTVLAYQAELQIDMLTYETDIIDPTVYIVKFSKRGMDPDSPTFHQSLSGLGIDKYTEAMKEENINLKCMNTWILVVREPHMLVLKVTWAFKLKRTPDGLVYTYCSRFCVRDNQQEHGFNYFETFVLVLQWSTI